MNCKIVDSERKYMGERLQAAINEAERYKRCVEPRYAGYACREQPFHVKTK
jgi:hypothetical protein